MAETQTTDRDTINLWEYDEPITTLTDDDHPDGYDVPAWIDQTITGSDIAAINQGGCSSGAYMPAVTYYDARQTMAEHGDDVLEFVEEHYGEIPQPQPGESWSGIAVCYLSLAVELWAGQFDLFM